MLNSDEILQDIAVFSSAHIVGDEYSSEYSSLGKANPVNIVGNVKSAKITKAETVLRGDDDDSKRKQQIADRVAEL